MATTSTTAAAPSTFKVGDVVQVDTWKIAVLGVQNPYVVEQQTVELYAPKAGEHYVALDVEVTNTDDKPQTFPAFVVNLENPAGHRYSAGSTMFLGGLESPNCGLDPGGTIRGPLYFSVPDDAADLVLTYWPSPLTKKARIPLR